MNIKRFILKVRLFFSPLFVRHKHHEEKGFIYVTGANIYVAENKAQEIYDKMPKKYGKKVNGTTSCVRKKGRY